MFVDSLGVRLINLRPSDGTWKRLFFSANLLIFWYRLQVWRTYRVGEYLAEPQLFSSKGKGPKSPAFAGHVMPFATSIE
jgi:hypothetical protein